jgi:hypothetical protein
MKEDTLAPALQLPPSHASVLTFAPSAGIVSAICGEEFEVIVAGKKYVSAKAASCLLRPSVGDTVLVQGVASAGVWILSVLVRSESEGAQIQLPRYSTILNDNGRISLRTQELEITSSDAEYRAKRMTVVFEDMRLIGKALISTIGVVKAIGQMLSTVADRIIQHSQTYSRTTQGMDRTDAQQCEINSEQIVRVKAPYVFLEGDDLVKTKGSQIHFG